MKTNAQYKMIDNFYFRVVISLDVVNNTYKNKEPSSTPSDILIKFS